MLTCLSSLHKRASSLQATQITSKGGTGMGVTGSTSAPQFEPSEWQNEYESFEPVAELNIVTFNMLAPCYKRISGETTNGRRERESDRSKIWNQRAEDTISFFETELLPTSSIIALQEFWLEKNYATMFEKIFENRGFEMRSLKRSGNKMDAVAIVYRKEDFEIKGSEDIYLCSVGDRVALLLWLCHKKTGKSVLVANTHLSFPHNVFDRMNQMRQMRKLTAAIDKFSKDKNVGPATRIITGDFNSEGQSCVCDHLRQAGYKSSFEICPPNQSEDSKNTYHSINTKGGKYIDVDSVDVDKWENDIDMEGFPSDMKGKSSSEGTGTGSPDHAVLRTTIEREADSTVLKSTTIRNEDIRRSEVSRKFVSHRTHTNEDLGVDHIFIKPEGILSGQELALEASRASSPKATPILLSSTIDNAKIGTFSASSLDIKNEEVYAELESDMDGIDTLRRVTEDFMADAKAYRSELEEKQRIRTVLLEKSDKDRVEKTEEHLIIHASKGAEAIDSRAVSAAERMAAALAPQESFLSPSNTVLFIANSRVIPSSIAIDTWPQMFLLSDHRPVSSSIILAKHASNKN
mmetsp:Transcript_25759/g.24611  ORF Transcript_25759/g.24611 Transcript_25759/m.24611 type:complete len:576 (+) Transcript_25759:229-1956(+)|eukprot:CAMPEP_0119034840 /NCGR_PEP_ID=MMETSP1177-20130426/1854_1 /TAXON_ID=2985 /ORGANISM="Ochromonas sp, Strain CCMP1899" /LENGTH=575 /DNA_ID=CAMNT_0006992611 /DNA_START=229 /DNA_END=1956 /DNA_ORIENTATION=-